MKRLYELSDQAHPFLPIERRGLESSRIELGRRGHLRHLNPGHGPRSARERQPRSLFLGYLGAVVFHRRERRA